MAIKQKNIAVLMTCHNRKDKTLQCLDALYKVDLPKDFYFAVFLVDDGSLDRTSESVFTYFPKVNIIKGDGNLFWNQGMRLAWETASKQKDFDYYLWLNDDTIVDNSAIVDILEAYELGKLSLKNEVVVTGACRNDKGIDNFSYGGKLGFEAVIPNGSIQLCETMNGNFVLISKHIYNRIGNLSNKFTHAMGDYEYGQRVMSADFKIITSLNFIATCPVNLGPENWADPNKKISERWKYFHSPLGLNIKEYKLFLKSKGTSYYMPVFLAYIHCIAPSLYLKIKRILKSK